MSVFQLMNIIGRPAVVEDRAQVRHDAALLPRPALQERAEPGDLLIAVELVERLEDRMVARNLDDRPIRKQPFHFALERVPLAGPWKSSIIAVPPRSRNSRSSGISRSCIRMLLGSTK
jgi:hypothetical protein